MIFLGLGRCIEFPSVIRRCWLRNKTEEVWLVEINLEKSKIAVKMEVMVVLVLLLLFMSVYSNDMGLLPFLFVYNMT